MTRSIPSFTRRLPAALAPAAALLLALSPSVGAAQHAGHAHHQADGAVAVPAATRRPPANPEGATEATSMQRVVRNGVAVEFAVVTPRRATDSAGRALPAGMREQEDAMLRLRLTDAGTGTPLRGLAPAVWIDRRGAERATAADACKLKVDRYVQAATSMEQALKARALVDLNSYVVLSLNRSPDISVLDPHLGFGKTKLYTTVRLRSPGEDWLLGPGDERLYVSMPAVGQIAVIDTDNWKVVANVDVGPTPTRLALSRDATRLWVATGGDSTAGVAVVDLATLRVAGRARTGDGAGQVVFDDTGRFAFVLNRRAGTVSVVDGSTVTKVKDIPVGAEPADIAWSPAGRMTWIVDARSGAVSGIDAVRHEVVHRVTLAPGLRTVRFAPSVGPSHGHHGNHAAIGTDGEAVGGRLGFVLNPANNTVTMIDGTTGAVLRTTEMGTQPDQVSFSSSFAYVRSAGSAEVAMIPLADPSAGGIGNLDRFPAGAAAPSAAGPLSEAAAIVQAPDMPDAVYVLNPKERMIYYFHYMEGMPIPSGGLTTYGFDPRAILVAGRDLRETEPGVYSATVRLADRGAYDLVFLLAEPRVTDCFPLEVHANPAIRDAKTSAEVVALSSRRVLRVGENVLRFRVSDLFSGEARSAIPDLGAMLVSTIGWRQRAMARPVGDGVYEVTLDVPAGGVYYLSFQAASLRLELNDRPPVIYRAVSAETAHGGR